MVLMLIHKIKALWIYLGLLSNFLDMWSLSHEAVSLGNENYLKQVLMHRDFQRAIKTTKILLDLRESLKVP